MAYKFSKAHDTQQPPPGVVEGTFSGDTGQYEVQIVLQNSRKIFAGPEKVTVPNNGSVNVQLRILRCENNNSNVLRGAKALAQFRRVDQNENFADGAARFINYKCS